MSEDRSTIAKPAGDFGMTSAGMGSSTAKAEGRKVLGTGGGTPVAGNDSLQGAKPNVEQKGEFTPNKD